TRPFIWRSNDKWTGQPDSTPPKKEGIFEGCMVARTLSEHVALLGMVKVESFKPSATPQGALMMAILAVLCALFCSISGEIQETGKESHFSKDNWGDYPIKTSVPNEPDQIAARATIFKARITKLTEQEWAAIMSTAAAFVGKKKKQAMAEAVADSLSASGPALRMTEEEKKAYDKELSHQSIKCLSKVNTGLSKSVLSFVRKPTGLLKDETSFSLFSLFWSFGLLKDA
ncbi:hypothetical protein CPB84DRAFT_1784837, partial [Gymnopilus junonius]